MTDTRINGLPQQPRFIFAHGAGADMDHAFMEQVAEGLAEQGIRVIRFNFPYMVKRAEDGKSVRRIVRLSFWMRFVRSSASRHRDSP